MRTACIVFSSLIVLLVISASFGQSYVREGSIGTLAARDTLMEQGDDGTALEFWVGKQFVIMQKPKSLHRYGYSTLRRPDGGFIIPLYDECAGQVATVIEVDAPLRTDRKLVLQLDDSTEYTAVSATDEFRELAPVSDIDQARARWLDRKVRLIGGSMYEYDALTGRVYEYRVRSNETLRVQEIVAGWDASRPVRFIVETEGGNEGFVDVQVTSTNVPDYLWGRYRAQAYFVEVEDLEN